MHSAGESAGLPRAWSPPRIVAATLATLVLLGGAGLFAARASAVMLPVPETGTPGYLSLRSDPYPAQFLELSPGSPARWQIAADITGAESASLTLEMRKDGALIEHPRGLNVSIERCDNPWLGFPDAPTCAVNRAFVTEATPLDDYTTSSPIFDLNGVTAANGKYLLVTLAVEDSAAAAADASLMNLTGDIGFGLTAAAADAPTQPSVPPVTPPVEPVTPIGPPTGAGPFGSLPRTGADIVALLAIGLGAVGLGAVVTSARAARNRAALSSASSITDRGGIR